MMLRMESAISRSLNDDLISGCLRSRQSSYQGPECHHIVLKLQGHQCVAWFHYFQRQVSLEHRLIRSKILSKILSIWVVTYIMGIKMMECGIWNICHLHRSEERYDAILDFSTKSLSDPHNQTSRQWSWRYCQWAQVPQPLAKQLLPAKKLPMEPRSLLDKHSWGWPLM